MASLKKNLGTKCFWGGWFRSPCKGPCLAGSRQLRTWGKFEDSHRPGWWAWKPEHGPQRHEEDSFHGLIWGKQTSQVFRERLFTGPLTGLEAPVQLMDGARPWTSQSLHRRLGFGYSKVELDKCPLLLVSLQFTEGQTASRKNVPQTMPFPR